MAETGDPFVAREANDLGEGRYRALFETLPDGILILDDEGRCVDANPSLCRFLGRPRERLLGARLVELAAPGRAESAARAFERLKSLGTLSGELPLSAADGTPLDLEWSARASFLPGFHVLAAHDVRARNQAERRLSAEHAVTRLLNEAQSLDDAAPGILEALCDTLGGRAGALWQLAPGAERLRCAAVWSCPGAELDAFKAATASLTCGRGQGLPGRVWAERTAAVIEELAQDPDFERRTVAAPAGLASGFGFPIAVGSELFGVVEFFTDRSFSPDEPLLLMMTAIGHDIAQFIRHRLAEAEVRRLHRDLTQKTVEHETILNSVPALIWYKDDKNNIVRVNRLAAQWAGLPQSQMEGRSTYELYPDEAESYYQDDLEVIRSGQPKLGIFEPIAGPGGEKHWVRTDKIPYRNADGEVIGVIVFAVNLP
ncbi:MAG TPA: PAS domain-containing protein [Thermoanaerobaculia bacterium]|nr:PAS domain-containing protein [Thermoanaerobaculia bacterium]